MSIKVSFPPHQIKVLDPNKDRSEFENYFGKTLKNTYNQNKDLRREVNQNSIDGIVIIKDPRSLGNSDLSKLASDLSGKSSSVVIIVQNPSGLSSIESALRGFKIFTE